MLIDHSISYHNSKSILKINKYIRFNHPSVFFVITHILWAKVLIWINILMCTLHILNNSTFLYAIKAVQDKLFCVSKNKKYMLEIKKNFYVGKCYQFVKKLSIVHILLKQHFILIELF